MKAGNLMAQDMFEKAREAFFGAPKTSPEPSAPSVEYLKPRNEPSLEDVNGPSPKERRAAQSVSFTHQTT